MKWNEIILGGIYEAQFSDHYYKVEWRNRLGFARAAIKSNVPVLPVFTVNIREAFRTLPFLGSDDFFWSGLSLLIFIGFKYFEALKILHIVLCSTWVSYLPKKQVESLFNL